MHSCCCTVVFKYENVYFIIGDLELENTGQRKARYMERNPDSSTYMIFRKSQECVGGEETDNCQGIEMKRGRAGMFYGIKKLLDTLTV